MVELNDVLKIAVQTGASDVHFKVGLPPMFRVDGDLLPLKEAARLSPEGGMTRTWRRPARQLFLLTA